MVLLSLFSWNETAYKAIKSTHYKPFLLTAQISMYIEIQSFMARSIIIVILIFLYEDLITYLKFHTFAMFVFNQ
jgi:hypothetical protein